jgi:Arc/MetJ-type ribon-helix-helix transcriptional regulator
MKKQIRKRKPGGGRKPGPHELKSYTVRLPIILISLIDAEVKSGRVTDRTSAIKSALLLWLSEIHND